MDATHQLVVTCTLDYESEFPGRGNRPHTMHDAARIMLSCGDRPLRADEIQPINREDPDQHPNYNDAIQVAADLIEPENYDSVAEGGNPEYVRGQVELICNLFGYAKYGEEPREAVEEDLRRAVVGVREPIFPSPDAPNLAQAWKDNPELQQMAELFGRLQSRRRSLLSDAETWSRAITLTLLDTLKRQLEGEEEE